MSLGFFIDTMDVDASQYAVMSMQMWDTKEFLHLYEDGKPYLDKPPLLFWFSSPSIGFFGVNNLGFKLPSFLMGLWSLYATYRFSRVTADENTARFAAFILASSQAMLLMTNDIRTDTLLMSWVITSMWAWKEWEMKHKTYWLLIAFAAMGMGMLAKGPIAFIAPITAIGFNLLLHKKWNKIFNWKHLLGFVVLALVLLPMSYGLYTQYDLHPEVLVNNKTNVSGLRFFYWEQSFGRITGENVWDNNAPFSFLFENMLWAFLPWTLVFIFALITSWVKFVTSFYRKNIYQHDWSALGGFTLVYIMLGMSHYQLPHYLFVVYPLAAVLTANYLNDLVQSQKENMLKFWSQFQYVLGFLLLIACVLLINIMFPEYKIWGNIGIALLLVGYIFLNKKYKYLGLLTTASFGSALIGNTYMNTYHYPNLLQYQASNNVGRYIRNNLPESAEVKQYNCEPDLRAMQFYASKRISFINNLDSTVVGDYIVTTTEELNKLKNGNVELEKIASYPNYKVSMLKSDFFTPNDREQNMDSAFLLLVKSKN